jgi:hypothetical protein
MKSQKIEPLSVGTKRKGIIIHSETFYNDSLIDLVKCTSWWQTTVGRQKTRILLMPADVNIRL